MSGLAVYEAIIQSLQKLTKIAGSFTFLVPLGAWKQAMFTPPPPPPPKKKKEGTTVHGSMKATLLQSLKDLAYAVSEKMQSHSFDKWNSPYVCLVRFLYMNVHASHNILCRVLRASSFLQFRNEAYNHYVARLVAGSGGEHLSLHGLTLKQSGPQ